MFHSDRVCETLWPLSTPTHPASCQPSQPPASHGAVLLYFVSVSPSQWNPCLTPPASQTAFASQPWVPNLALSEPGLIVVSEFRGWHKKAQALARSGPLTVLPKQEFFFSVSHVFFLPVPLSCVYSACLPEERRDLDDDRLGTTCLLPTLLAGGGKRRRQ